MANTVILSAVAGLLLLSIWTEARSMPQVDESSKDIAAPTCVYNGVGYNDGDELPTGGHCWHCTCRPGFVVPGPEFCARISCPNYGDNGCEPVYSEDACCPVAWNCDNLNETQPQTCDERFLQHYKVKQCIPEFEEGSSCPSRFNCPAQYLTDNTVCYHDGKTYKVKETISTGNPCRICSCESVESSAFISCVSIECPSAFGVPMYKDGCYPTFALNSCCSTGEACDDPANGTVSEPLCELDGKLYHAGQQMYSKSDPCLTCICDENWTGVSNSSCRKLGCMLEEKLSLLKEGCLPIYHESTCCPIEYYCDSSNELILPGKKSSSDDEADPLKQCVYKDKRGNIGDVLQLNRSNDCVTCTCNTPPDFTCIHKTCPGPPNDDYDNCKAHFTPGQCCATYECVQYAPSQPICDPVYCREGCTEISVTYGCPMCLCNEVLCSPPACGPDCVIDYSASPCPACKCAETFPLDRPLCGPVRCGPQCYEGISPQGCPMCVCGPLCSPPKCEYGCHVVTDVPEGQCPYCECEQDEQEDQLPERALKVLCSPVRCPSQCSEATGQHGCPMCVCEPLCSPPKCEPGCRMEVVPSSGPCPGCTCDQQITGALQCAPVKCPAGCTEYVPSNSCPMCQCNKILCSMPLCPSGCEINRNPAPGTCPDCRCPETIPFDRPLCAPVKCGPGCHEGISPQGCPMCVCGPLCSPPKCELGCRIQKDVPEGQCPGCECQEGGLISDRTFRIRCAPVRCPLDCREGKGPNGCPLCLCDPLCSPPKCDPGCRAEVVPTQGPCPGCVCDQIEKPQCGPVHCGPDCYESVSPQGCPTCVCGPLCSPPQCPYSCYVERNVPVGHCPGCECPSVIRPPFIGLAPTAEYTAENCPPVCRVEEKDGSPQCICDPLCSMPKCPDECPLKMDVPSGTCPFCDCPIGETAPDIVAKGACPPTCQSLSKDGISSCVCDKPECSPPKCNPGCTVQKDVPEGACPGCDCPSTIGRSISFSAPMAPPPIQCLSGCQRVIGANGLPRCVCTPICAIPRCASGCPLKQNPGGCPYCDCAKKAFPWCPPVLTCDEGCVKVTSSSGCDACKCGDECVPPKCPSGCEIAEQTNANECPACSCKFKASQDVRCPDMPCELPCRWVRLSPTTCPMCQCTPNFDQLPDLKFMGDAPVASNEKPENTK